MSFLELNAINKRFGHFTALKEINLAIESGEFICFLGPSGCGKTTLLRIIAGLEAQTSGQIFQKGQEITTLPPAKRDYGIVFQSYALFPNLSVSDNIAYGLVNQKNQKDAIEQKINALLHLIGLPDSGKKYPSQLSGGQQQRVALARALATSPNLLLLDEPLSALDATVRIHLREELCRLQKQLGITTIMVTHDQEEALAIADRVVIMNHGVIEQIGTPLEVYHHPANPFVADFVGKINQLDALSEGDHYYRCGDEIIHAPDVPSHPKGEKVRLYLRPEDRKVEFNHNDAAQQFTGIIKDIEFLGGTCLAELEVPTFAKQSIRLQFSLNQVYDLGIELGKSLPFAFRPERINVFAS